MRKKVNLTWKQRLIAFGICFIVSYCCAGECDYARVCVCVCVCVCVGVGVGVHACACVRTCVHVCGKHTHFKLFGLSLLELCSPFLVVLSFLFSRNWSFEIVQESGSFQSVLTMSFIILETALVLCMYVIPCLCRFGGFTSHCADCRFSYCCLPMHTSLNSFLFTFHPYVCTNMYIMCGHMDGESLYCDAGSNICQNRIGSICCVFLCGNYC